MISALQACLQSLSQVGLAVHCIVQLLVVYIVECCQLSADLAGAQQ
jgi:hypothetical protein